MRRQEIACAILGLLIASSFSFQLSLSAQAESTLAQPTPAESTQAPQSKQAESTQTESKQAESKQAESTQAESKQAESKQAESKQAESKQAESKQAESTQSEPTQSEPTQSESTQSESTQADTQPNMDINSESQTNKSGEGTESEQSVESESKPLTVEDIPAKLREAMISNKRGAHLECIEICNQIIALEKDNMQALAYRGRSHVAAKKPKEAVEDLSRVISTNGGSHQVLGARALAYLQLEEFQKAIEDSTKAIEKNPKNQEYFIIRALSLHRTKENKKALDDINKGLALDPEGPNQAIFLLARSDVYNELNRDDDCLKDLNKIVKLKPQDAQSYMNRANFFLKSKNWEKVIADLDSVINYAPMGHLSNNALILRADAERESGKYTEAESDYSSLLAGYPKDTTYLYGRAESRFHLRSFAAALKDINKCIELEKDNPKFFDLRSKIFAAMQEKEKAATGN